jgi:hypothetical protein
VDNGITMMVIKTTRLAMKKVVNVKVMMIIIILRLHLHFHLPKTRTMTMTMTMTLRRGKVRQYNNVVGQLVDKDDTIVKQGALIENNELDHTRVVESHNAKIKRLNDTYYGYPSSKGLSNKL